MRIILFWIFLLILLNSNNISAQFKDNNTLDCDDNNPNIFPGAIEICNDNLDNNCNMDQSILFDTDPNTGKDLDDIECCNLLSAQWSTSSTSIGSLVTLSVTGTFGCLNTLVNFQVFEDDTPPNADDAVTKNPASATFQNNTAVTTWIAEWQDDGIGNPEYYFIASSQFDTQTSSAPLLIVSEGVVECGDGNLDLGETCFSCPNDAGCNNNQTCLNQNDTWQCVIPGANPVCGNKILEIGETCLSCSQDLPTGFCQNICNNNGVCDIGETCLCGECLGEQSTCIIGNVCNQQGLCSIGIDDGLCTGDEDAKNDDPECCNVISANWNTNIAPANSLVKLIVQGNEFCQGRDVSFSVFEDEIGSDTYVPPDPSSKTFNNESKAESEWTVANLDDGFFQDQAEFYFNASSGISSMISGLLETIICEEDDSDCDGVKDIDDKCPDTPIEEIKNVDSTGCAQGEASCVIEWDCSNTVWSECNEQGYRTRDITKCTYNGNNEICRTKFKPLEQQPCLVDESFPVFTTYNIILSLLFITMYYFLSLKIKR